MDEEKEYYLLVKKVFRILAPIYDIGTIPISGVRDKTVDFTDAGKGSKILDVATGTGKQALAFAERGYDVTGIDLSEAMLKVASKKNKYEKAKFALADATNLPFKDSSFDVSCISFALHDMPLSIREKALKEMVRVTKPEGTKFIKSDFESLLRKSGIGIKEKLPVLVGVGRILKGVNLKLEL